MSRKLQALIEWLLVLVFTFMWCRILNISNIFGYIGMYLFFMTIGNTALLYTRYKASGIKSFLEWIIYDYETHSDEYGGTKND